MTIGMIAYPFYLIFNVISEIYKKITILLLLGMIIISPLAAIAAALLLIIYVCLFLPMLIYNIFNILENILDIINFTKKIDFNKIWILFFASISCLLCWVFGNQLAINVDAALIGFFAFFIMTILSLFSNPSKMENSDYMRKEQVSQDNILSITSSTKLMYTVLSATSALVAFGLESSSVYFFTPATLTLAIIAPTILVSAYTIFDTLFKINIENSKRGNNIAFSSKSFLMTNFSFYAFTSKQGKQEMQQQDRLYL